MNDPSPPVCSGNPIRALLLLSALAIAHRAVITNWTCAVAADGPRYMWAAQDFSKGDYDRAYGSRLHPLYPLLCAAAGTVLGSVERGGYLVSLVASSLVLVPLFVVTRALLGPRVALWSCFLYALHPTLALEGTENFSTGFFLATFTTSFDIWFF